MTPEERQMLGNLFERIHAAGATQRDPQAESFINDAVRSAPFAPYVLTQTVLVQQHALEAASQRIAQLEAAAQQSAEQHQEQGGFLGNLGRTIFGGAPSTPPTPPRQNIDASSYQQAPQRGPEYPPPPPPSGYAPQRPGPWGGGGGGGFLQNAASTAAGVAGGVALGNLLGGLFGGHGGGLFGGSNAGFLGGGLPGGNETVNIFEQAPNSGNNTQFDPSMPDDAGFIDDSSFDDGAGGGGFDDV